MSKHGGKPPATFNAVYAEALEERTTKLEARIRDLEAPGRRGMPIKNKPGLCDCPLCKKMAGGAAALVFTRDGDMLEVHTAIVQEGENAEALGRMANRVLQNIMEFIKEERSSNSAKVKFDA